MKKDLQNNMHIMHITCGYEKKKLYENLFNQLADLDLVQEVIAPYYDRINVKGDEKFIIVPYKRDRNLFKRLMIKSRSRILSSFIIENTNLENKVIHAHSLFSDGAVAYYLNKKFKIPYIVAVRNSDINVYYKYFLHLRQFGFDILNNASKVLFLSYAYKKNVIENVVPSHFKDLIQNKSVVCPNGIDEIWFQNREYKTDLNQDVRLLYIGEYRFNKNIHSVVEAVNILNKRGMSMSLTAFGKGKNDEPDYVSKLDKLESKTFRTEKSLKSTELISNYKDYDIFVMPSFTETFGLVYVEALTQGLPIIYTRGQGFDGFFEDGVVGYSVDPNDINDIANKIQLIVNNYHKISNNIANINLDMFKWDNIALSYKDIYESIKA